jgi:hypothetical protein
MAKSPGRSVSTWFSRDLAGLERGDQRHSVEKVGGSEGFCYRRLDATCRPFDLERLLEFQL